MKEKIEKIPRSWLALWVGLVIYFLMTCLPFTTSYSFVVGLSLFATGFIPGFITAIIDRKNALVSALSVYVLISLDRFWVSTQYLGDRYDYKDCIMAMSNVGNYFSSGGQAVWDSIRSGFDLTTLAGFLVAAFLVWWLMRKHKLA